MIASVFALAILGAGVVSLAIALWFEGWRTDRKYRREMELVERKARGCWEKMR